MAKSVCLGCGTVLEPEAECELCYSRLAHCLDVFAHWPLEVYISPGALAEVEIAIRHHLHVGGCRARVQIELSNMVNIIRSHLQHVAAGLKTYRHPPRKAEPTDEDLLS